MNLAGICQDEGAAAVTTGAACIQVLRVDGVDLKFRAGHNQVNQLVGGVGEQLGVIWLPVLDPDGLNSSGIRMREQAEKVLRMFGRHSGAGGQVGAEARRTGG
jgi:hypothetical protein